MCGYLFKFAWGMPRVEINSSQMKTLKMKKQSDQQLFISG